MDTRKLTEEVSVSSQITDADVTTLVAAGFRSIICNRPDGESADQQNVAEIRAAAENAGLQFCDLPVISGQVTYDDVVAFRKAIADLPGPILAYCRSGTRSTMLWALAESDTRPPAEILALAKAAGYDMSGVVRHTANKG